MARRKLQKMQKTQKWPDRNERKIKKKIDISHFFFNIKLNYIGQLVYQIWGCLKQF